MLLEIATTIQITLGITTVTTILLQIALGIPVIATYRSHLAYQFVSTCALRVPCARETRFGFERSLAIKHCKV